MRSVPAAVSEIAMPTRHGPVPGGPVTLISPPRPCAIWSTPGRVGVRAVLAEARDDRVDEPRVHRPDRVGIDAEPVLHRRAGSSRRRTSALLDQAEEAPRARRRCVRSTTIERLLRWRFAPSDAERRERTAAGAALHLRSTSAPKSASWRTQVGPARACVRSTTRMPASGPADAPDGGAYVTTTRRTRRPSAVARESARGAGEEPLAAPGT